MRKWNPLYSTVGVVCLSGLTMVLAMFGIVQLMEFMRPTYIGCSRVVADAEEMNLWGGTYTADDLSKLSGMKSLLDLHLDSAVFDGPGLQVVGQVKTLRRLTLSYTKVTNEMLEHLKGLNDLRILELNKTAISDGGLAHLSGLMRLKQLQLRFTNVSGAGLRHLTSLPLERLDLSHTFLSDDAVASLASMKQLRRLNVSQCRNFSIWEVSQLQKALPQCIIEY